METYTVYLMGVGCHTEIDFDHTPEVGELIDDLPNIPNGNCIAYVVDPPKSKMIVGPRYMAIEGFPLLSVDLSKATLRCSRCGKTTEFEAMAYEDDDGAQILSKDSVLNALTEIVREHEDCARPICLN